MTSSGSASIGSGIRRFARRPRLRLVAVMVALLSWWSTSDRSTRGRFCLFCQQRSISQSNDSRQVLWMLRHSLIETSMPFNNSVRSDPE